jgi:hypothetical protein
MINVLFMVGAAVIGIFFLIPKLFPTKAADVPPAPAPPAPSTIAPSGSPSTTAPTVGAVTEGLATRLGNEILPGAGVVTGKIAGTYVEDFEELAAGHVSIENVAEVVFFPVAVTATAVDAIVDLFGLGAKPLGDVKYILLMQHNNYPAFDVNNNVQYGQPIYALGTDSKLHRLEADVNAADYSWREIIGVMASIIGVFEVGAPFTHRSQLSTMARPASAADIRGFFGNNAIFKMGASNDIYNEHNAGAATPIPGGPYDIVTAKARARRASRLF